MFGQMEPPSQIDPRERSIILSLKKERERQGISAAELARKIGVGRNTIPNLERNEARPTLWVVLKMCDGLKISLKKLLD
jgi:DNA-binding XRE family transcriptional regulator